MIAVRLFTLEDAELLCPKATEYKHWKGGDWRAWAEDSIKDGPAYVGLLDGSPIMAGGVSVIDEGRGWVWAIFSKEIKKHKKDVLRCVKDMLDLIMSHHNLSELWALSNKNFAPSQRLLRHLGFKKMGEADDDNYTYMLKA